MKIPKKEKYARIGMKRSKKTTADKFDNTIRRNKSKDFGERRTQKTQRQNQIIEAK